MLVEDGADGETDGVLALERRAEPVDPGLDGGEIALGCREQVLAFPGALAGEIRVAADDQGRVPPGWPALSG